MIDQLLLSLVLIVASLLAGVAVGLFRKQLGPGEKKMASAAMTVLVLLLIFFMGVKTGLNRDVMSGLGAYGLKALLLALGAIAGSVLCVMAFDRFTSRGPSR